MSGGTRRLFTGHSLLPGPPAVPPPLLLIGEQGGLYTGDDIGLVTWWGRGGIQGSGLHIFALETNALLYW